MQILEVLSQGTSWLFLIINGVALYAVITWPAVKGRAWFVAFLTSTVLGQLYFRVFDAVVRYAADEPRYELCETFRILNSLVMLFLVAAHVFLVVAVFQLRTFLQTSVALSASTTDQRTLIPSMYCLACFYPLDHLQRDECPECGRSFDPSNRSTYAKHPKKCRWTTTLLVWSPPVVLAGIHSLLWSLLAFLVVISDDPEAGMVFYSLRDIDFFFWDYALSHPNTEMLLFWLGGLQWAVIGLPVVLLIVGIRVLRGRSSIQGNATEHAYVLRFRRRRIASWDELKPPNDARPTTAHATDRKNAIQLQHRGIDLGGTAASA